MFSSGMQFFKESKPRISLRVGLLFDLISMGKALSKTVTEIFPEKSGCHQRGFSRLTASQNGDDRLILE